MPVLLPIYMLHQVAPRHISGWEPHLFLTPAGLRRMILSLLQHGVHFVTMSEAWRLIGDGDPRPRAVALTFDDLGESFEEYVLPILVEFDLPATVFVISGMLRGEVPQNVVGLGNLPSCSSLRQWVDAGIEIGSHTYSHRILTELSPAELQRELDRAPLEDALGRPVTSLAYPRGSFDERVITAVAEAGYECACTTLRGNLHEERDRFQLKRIRAKESRGSLGLWYTLTRWYDFWNRRRAQKQRTSEVTRKHDANSLCSG